MAATAQAAEVSELKRKLELADDDIDRINKRFKEAEGMVKMPRVPLRKTRFIYYQIPETSTIQSSNK